MPDGSGFPTAMPIRDIPSRMADRLIVALDVPTVTQAEQLVAQLDGVVSFFKIGLWLLFAKDTDQFIQKLIDDGKEVFLDYKMYDIGETVKQGVKRAAERGVKFITVHGDPEIIRKAVEGRNESPASKLKVFCITVLTSLSDNDLAEMGYTRPVQEVIQLRVRNAIANKCDGIIASPSDHPDEIRKLVQAEHLLIATPGIRQSGTSTDDHQRFASAHQTR